MLGYYYKLDSWMTYLHHSLDGEVIFIIESSFKLKSNPTNDGGIQQYMKGIQPPKVHVFF